MGDIFGIFVYLIIISLANAATVMIVIYFFLARPLQADRDDLADQVRELSLARGYNRLLEHNQVALPAPPAPVAGPALLQGAQKARATLNPPTAAWPAPPAPVAGPALLQGAQKARATLNPPTAAWPATPAPVAGPALLQGAQKARATLNPQTAAWPAPPAPVAGHAALLQGAQEAGAMLALNNLDMAIIFVPKHRSATLTLHN